MLTFIVSPQYKDVNLDKLIKESREFRATAELPGEGDVQKGATVSGPGLQLALPRQQPKARKSSVYPGRTSRFEELLT